MVVRCSGSFRGGWVIWVRVRLRNHIEFRPLSFCIILSCVAWRVSCESVLALGCCKSWGAAGGEGRVPSLMTAAVESDASESYFFSFIFDVWPEQVRSLIQGGFEIPR